MYTEDLTATGLLDRTRYDGGADFIEDGTGPLAVLIHSSAGSARQWSPLMQTMRESHCMRAVNLFGYGNTPPWPGAPGPTLDDFASLVADVVPPSTPSVHLVGHSLGGAVAMQAAARQLKGRVASLTLIEPSLFYLLPLDGRHEAYEEIIRMALDVKRLLAGGALETAAQIFIDYWSGAGTWSAMPPERKLAVARAVRGALHEFNAVASGEMTLADWSQALPRRRLLVSAAVTKRPCREIVETLARRTPGWSVCLIDEGGHMSPITHPHLVNPVIQAFLTE